MGPNPELMTSPYNPSFAQHALRWDLIPSLPFCHLETLPVLLTLPFTPHLSSFPSQPPPIPVDVTLPSLLPF